MQISKNYYAILGVSSRADENSIRVAYRALIAKYHPDVNPSANAAQRAAEITEAFSILSKETLRRAYDAARNPAPHPENRDTISHARQSEGNRRYHRSSTSSAAPTAAAEERLFRSPEPRWARPGKQNLMASLGSRLQELRGAVVADRSTWRNIGRWVGGLLLIALLIWALRAGLLLIFERGGSNSAPAVERTASSASSAAALPASTPAAQKAPAAADDIKPPATQTQAGPAPILQADSVNNALSQFASIFYRSGMDGAIQRSKACHNEAMATKDWKKTDFCNAFDDVGVYLDGRSRQASAPAVAEGNPSYFELIANRSTQTTAYLMLSNANSGFTDRVDKIQKMVESAVQPTISARIFGAQVDTGGSPTDDPLHSPPATNQAAANRAPPGE